jgi:hypothetical protein
MFFRAMGVTSKISIASSTVIFATGIENLHSEGQDTPSTAIWLRDAAPFQNHNLRAFCITTSLPFTCGQSDTVF